MNNHDNGNIINLKIIELRKLYREDLEKVLENLRLFILSIRK